MDITQFIVSSREQAMLYGDYATYRSQLGRRLLKCRKKLKITTKHRGKYHPKAALTPEQVAENIEYLHHQLLTSERAWAHALSMKTAHESDTKGVSSHTRSHMVSRLDKAAKTSARIVEALSEAASGASPTDFLEAQAYAGLIRGTADFENRHWERCLKSFSISRVIYSALSSSSKSDVHRDLLSETIDPSIRYAAYQLKTPRSLTIPAIARQYFPQSDERLVKALNTVAPNYLEESAGGAGGDSSSAEGAAPSLTWRSREVRIEDAAIATAWASVQAAKAKLSEFLRSQPDAPPKEKAAAYDDVLTASQDAVDATKEAIDELKGDGVSQSDPRMQSLYVTRTAVNYEMISWRIGRNRVLTGEHDGIPLESGPMSRRAARKQAASTQQEKPVPPGRLIARLKEKLVLYDATLQSLDTIRELPGVAADEGLSSDVDSTYAYFNALKCLAIARSYSIIGDAVNTLALINHAADQLKTGAGEEDQQMTDASAARDVNVSSSELQFLQNTLQGEMQRSRALVDILQLRKQNSQAGGQGDTISLGDRLHEYPSNVNLEKLIDYPPKYSQIPVKPIFLDVAWNYIDYPAKPTTAAQPKQQGGQAAAPEPKAQKRGWFGFGR